MFQKLFKSLRGDAEQSGDQPALAPSDTRISRRRLDRLRHGAAIEAVSPARQPQTASQTTTEQSSEQPVFHDPDSKDLRRVVKSTPPAPARQSDATDPLNMKVTPIEDIDWNEMVDQHLPVVMAMENHAVREFLMLCSRNENPNWDEARRTKHNADMEAAILTQDPLDVAIDLHFRVPSRRRLPNPEGDMRRFNNAFDQVFQRAWKMCGHAIEFNDAQMRKAIASMGKLIASGCNNQSTMHDYFYWHIVRAAAADSWPKWKEPLIDALSAAFAGRSTDHKNVVEMVERILEMTDLTAADIPELVAAEQASAKLNAIRAKIASDLGEPMGAAFIKLMDADRYNRGSCDAELAAVKDLPAKVRGEALVRYMDVLSNLDRYGSTHWGQLRREKGKYHFGINYQRFPGELGAIIQQLMRRKIELADPDVSLARLFGWLEHFSGLGDRKLLKLFLETAKHHPTGQLAEALRAWVNAPGKHHPFKEYRIEIEDVVRYLPTEAEAEPSAPSPQGLGKKNAASSASPLQGLQPLPVPEADFVSYGYWTRLREHFDNFLDVRLYDQPHRNLLRKLAVLDEALKTHHDSGGDQSHAALARVVAQGGFPGVDFAPAFLPEITRIGAQLHSRIEAFAPFVEQHPEAARKLRSMVATLAGKSSPTQKWIKEGKEALKDVATETIVGMIDRLMENPVSGVLEIRDDSTLRALIFLSGMFDADTIGSRLMKFAVRDCYVKQSGHGTVPGMKDQKLGNACVLALSEMPDGAGIPYMARIQARVKYPKVKAFIDKRLDAAAKKAGMTRGELDEVTVPTHGLDKEGALTRSIQGGTAGIRIDDGSVVQVWTSEDGKVLKSPSTAMKTDMPVVKAIRDLAKLIKTDLSIQSHRLQRIYLEKRDWPVQTWHSRYCLHPLVGSLGKRLIWWLDKADGSSVSVLPSADGQSLTASSGEEVFATEDDRIRLWHPIEASVEQIEAWRDRLEELKVEQPFSQAWREVYMLTDAERETGTYSNRWAAHILRQHQTMELARANGWRVTHRLGYDVKNDEPWHRMIADYGLVADYWVAGCGGEHAEYSQGGAYTYITTDRVQFYTIDGASKDSARGPKRGEAVELDKVPPIVFSEIMRQGDLFTSIASIGNDPTWLDDGADAEHPNDWHHIANAYWKSVNTGDLEVSAMRRLSILERTIPRLKIADKLTLDDRFLHVQGTRGRYKIHLGGGGVFNGERHMCIVPKNETRLGKVWLPFEGDRTLSIILSKATLLVADDKITDPVILAQLP